MDDIVDAYAFGKIADFLLRSVKIGDYFNPIIDHLAIRIHGRGESTRSYNDVGQYWRDEIDPIYYGGPPGSRHELLQNDVVELRNFKLTEWVPWSPGTLWTRESNEMRLHARDYIVSQGEYGTLYNDIGKTFMVGSGIGNVRLEQHNNSKLLCATTESASHGIPVVLTSAAYQRIQQDLERHGVVAADVLGYHCSVARLGNNFLDGIIEYGRGVPRNCILVDSPMNIEIISKDTDVAAHALSIYGDLRANWNFCFSSFDPRNAGSIQSAADFLNRFAQQYRGEVLFDFDEVCMRTNALFPLSEIRRGLVNRQQLGLVISSLRKYCQRHRLVGNELDDAAQRIDEHYLPVK
jgi:hypothetical protein